MATLAEAVDAAETDWLVSADIPDTVDYLTVESEVVQVTATFPAQYQARDGSTSEPRIRVVRAAGGTTAASHADATALTPLIPPSSAAGGAAEAGTVVVTPPLEVDVAAALEGANAPGGGNPLATLADVAVSSHLLGPYRVNFDDPGIDTGLLLTTLDEGTWVWGISVITITPAGGDEGVIDFRVGIEAIPGWLTTDLEALTSPGPEALAMTGIFTFTPVGVAGASGGLYVGYSTQNPASQGAWDIYVLVAVTAP